MVSALAHRTGSSSPTTKYGGVVHGDHEQADGVVGVEQVAHRGGGQHAVGIGEVGPHDRGALVAAWKSSRPKPSVRVRHAVRVADRVRVREIDDDDVGRRLLRIVRRGTGSVVTWRRAQMVLLSAQGMPVARIAGVTFTSADRVRDVIHNLNADGFDSLYPKYKGGRPRTFTLPERREIKKIAKSRPVEHGLPFSTWSLAKLADFLVAEGWSTTSATRDCASCSARKASPFNA
jgi:transposase